MLKQTDFSSPDGHIYLKCKSCKQEFYVVSAAYYNKTINFCPYCGDYAHRIKNLKGKEDLEGFNNGDNNYEDFLRR